MRIPRPRPPRRPAHPLEMWAGHYSAAFMVAALAAAIVKDALKAPGGGLGEVLDAPSWIAVAAMYADMSQHSWRLCERCARATPLDGQEAARRWRLALRWTHGKGRFALAVLLALMITWHAVAGRHVPWVYWAGDAALFAAITASYIAMRQHHRLQPWCPWCNWGRGGDKEPSPDVPVPSESK